MNAENPVQIDLFGVSATRTKDTRPTWRIGGSGASQIAVRPDGQAEWVSEVRLEPDHDAARWASGRRRGVKAPRDERTASPGVRGGAGPGGPGWLR
jgi:hypothetical protein